MDEIGLGDRVRDPITGFEGIVVCVSRWLHGCVRVSVQPEMCYEGKPAAAEHFDAPQLAVVERAAVRPTEFVVVAPSSSLGRVGTGGPVRETVGFVRR